LNKCLVAFLLVTLFSLSSFAQDAEKTFPSALDSQPPKAGTRIRLGGNVMKKQLKHKVNALYPQEARSQKFQGTVRLHIVVGTDGKVLQAEVVAGPSVFTQVSLDAVRKWEYKPVLLNGAAVEVDSTVDVVFSLVE
jgi:TonB family protein